MITDDFQDSRQNQPIRSSKWSEQLKSKSITMKQNAIILTNQTCQLQFCLLNASFSNTLQQKQSWAIQINNNSGGINLGICLKSRMIKQNFNGNNINWEQTGHGLYMINQVGQSYSHSQKEFNWVCESFLFKFGDVIYVEYDPIDSKLRFIKNKNDGYFEMPIIAPPQNDAYHPCVTLFRYGQSVELLPLAQCQQ